MSLDYINRITTIKADVYLFYSKFTDRLEQKFEKKIIETQLPDLFLNARLRIKYSHLQSNIFILYFLNFGCYMLEWN